MSRQNTELKIQEKATFVLEIQFMQNASWQGTVKWLGKRQILYFRSALELIKIIDSVREKDCEVKIKDADRQMSV